eukprot:XP_019921931.1 PREDICTED: uncharacterized protein LOC109618505 [Crassostrea gigas]
MAIEKSRSNSRVAEKLTEDEMVNQKFRKLWSLAKIGSTQEQQLQLTRVNRPLGGTQSCDVAIIGPGDRKEGQLFTNHQYHNEKKRKISHISLKNSDI